MKNYIGILLILGMVFSAQSQQTVQYTHYLMNYFAINPAVAGAKECVDARIGARSQWVNYDGAPTTGFGTFYAPLNFKKRKSIYTRHGIGAKVESERLGLTGTSTINLAYAYHFQMTKKLKASFGVFAGIKQFKFNSADAFGIVGNDPAIQAASSRIVWPDVTPGIFVYDDNLFAGFSIRQLLFNKIKDYGTNTNRKTQHFDLMAGYKFRAGKINVIPSALLKFTFISAPALDLNLMLEFRESIQLGIGYRNQDALAGLIKIPLLKNFILGYAFDFTTSKLRHGSSNTHEFIIGYTTCPSGKKSTYLCPAFN